MSAGDICAIAEGTKPSMAPPQQINPKKKRFMTVTSLSCRKTGLIAHHENHVTPSNHNWTKHLGTCPKWELAAQNIVAPLNRLFAISLSIPRLAWPFCWFLRRPEPSHMTEKSLALIGNASRRTRWRGRKTGSKVFSIRRQEEAAGAARRRSFCMGIRSRQTSWKARHSLGCIVGDASL